MRFPVVSDFEKSLLAAEVLPKAIQIDEFLQHDIWSGGFAARTWPKIISDACPEIADLPLSKQLLALHMCTMHNRITGRATSDFNEGFSGASVITLHMLKAGLSGFRFDKKLDVAHDLTTPQGLRLWLASRSLLKRGALDQYSPECGSHSIVCRNVSKRAENNAWRGNDSLPFVERGNAQLDATASPLSSCLCFPNPDWHRVFGVGVINLPPGFEYLRVLRIELGIQNAMRLRRHRRSNNENRGNVRNVLHIHVQHRGGQKEVARDASKCVVHKKANTYRHVHFLFDVSGSVNVYIVHFPKGRHVHFLLHQGERNGIAIPAELLSR